MEGTKNQRVKESKWDKQDFPFQQQPTLTPEQIQTALKNFLAVQVHSLLDHQTLVKQVISPRSYLTISWPILFSLILYRKAGVKQQLHAFPTNDASKESEWREKIMGRGIVNMCLQMTCRVHFLMTVCMLHQVFCVFVTSFLRRYSCEGKRGFHCNTCL